MSACRLFEVVGHLPYPFGICLKQTEDPKAFRAEVATDLFGGLVYICNDITVGGLADSTVAVPAYG